MSASNFAGFVLEDIADFQAERDTPRDQQLQEYVTEGFLEMSSKTKTDRCYMLTSRGVSAVRGWL